MIILFMVAIGGGLGVFNTEIDTEIEYRTEDVRAQALTSAMLNDHMWRARGIDQGKYNNELAKEVLSDYFSTSGDEVYFGENEIPKSEVKSDLEAYFEYKLDRNLVQSTDFNNYELKLEHGSGSIEVSEGSISAGQGIRSNFRVGLTNGEYALGTLRIEAGNDGSAGGNII